MKELGCGYVDKTTDFKPCIPRKRNKTNNSVIDDAQRIKLLNMIEFIHGYKLTDYFF